MQLGIYFAVEGLAPAITTLGARAYKGAHTHAYISCALYINCILWPGYFPYKSSCVLYSLDLGVGERRKTNETNRRDSDLRMWDNEMTCKVAATLHQKDQKTFRKQDSNEKGV